MDWLAGLDFHQKRCIMGDTSKIESEGVVMSTSPWTLRFQARDILQKLWSGDQGQDIAEYAVMLAVILVIVVGTIRLIGSNANTVFSQAASSIQ